MRHSLTIALVAWLVAAPLLAQVPPPIPAAAPVAVPVTVPPAPAPAAAPPAATVTPLPKPPAAPAPAAAPPVAAVTTPALPVTPAAPAPASPPAAAQAPALPVPPQPPTPAAAPAKPAQKAGYRSIMYRDEEISQMLQAVDVYQRNMRLADEERDRQNNNDYLSALEAAMRARGYISYPQFYLSAIVHRGESDWTLWINGIRLTPTNRGVNEGIVVKDVDQLRASFIWHPDAQEFPRLLERYNDYPNPAIGVNEAEQTFLFSLSPNQSFSSYTMTIVEGYLPTERRIEYKGPINASGIKTRPGAILPNPIPSDEGAPELPAPLPTLPIEDKKVQAAVPPAAPVVLTPPAAPAAAVR